MTFLIVHIIVVRFVRKRCVTKLISGFSVKVWVCRRRVPITGGSTGHAVIVKLNRRSHCMTLCGTCSSCQLPSNQIC